jgi:hypothetical protein
MLFCNLNSKEGEKPCSPDTVPQNKSALDVPTRNFSAPLRTLNMETELTSKSNVLKIHRVATTSPKGDTL